MSRSITDARQVTLRAFLQQIANAATYAGTADSKPANQSELDNLLAALNEEVTPLLRMSAASTPSLVVTVGAGKLTNSESSYTRAIPHVGTAYVQFAAGTLTFPASSGGNIVASPGNNSVLTLGVGNYSAILVYLDGNGNLNTIVGAEDASETVAITNLAPAPDSTLPIGYIVVHNTAGVIDAIAQTKISQFGTGAGGGGSGDASLAEVALRDNFVQSTFKYLDPNVFKREKATKVDGSSTGSFDLVKSAFKFTSIGQTYVSTNLANAEFLAEGVDITDIELEVYWLLNFIDSAATYEASRDGGTNWSTLTMDRVGTASNAFRTYKSFTDESVQQNLQGYSVANADSTPALNASTTQQRAQGFTVSTTQVLRSMDVYLNKLGSALGNFKVQIVRDSAGQPSTSPVDIISESSLQSISALSAGNNTVTISMPQAVLAAGSYWLVFATDAAYQASFSAGVTELRVRADASSPTTSNSSVYNGTAWSTLAGTALTYQLKGRVHDLRLRITGSAALKYIEAIGTSFGIDDGVMSPNGSKNVQRFYFSGDSNQTNFLLNWTPDPDLVEFYDVYRGQVYVIDNDTIRISGQTVTFAPNTFNFPGESILLIARQIKGIGIDNSDSNAANISTHSANLLDIGDQASDLEYVTIPKISVPNTSIINRSQMPDLSQDLNSRMGINRLFTQYIYTMQSEVGPNGEAIFGAANDRLNQIRLVGSWTSVVGADGAYALSAVANDYIEVTFYGTGINLLGYAAGSSRDIRVTIDGGAEGANILPATNSGVLASRNYAINSAIAAASGLTLGIHTAKFRYVSGPNMLIYGFETLNESSSIVVNPGSQFVRGSKRTLASQQSLAYNSVFETGTLGTKGGRVLIYQKSDSSIAKALQPTDASSLTLNSASHSNEEIARVYGWREFGAGRADDFSLLTTSGTSRTFTLDDGTTTLTCSSTFSAGSGSGFDGIAFTTSGNFITLTFVGTGLDILIGTDGSTRTVDSISIDGAASIGSLSLAANSNPVMKRIVSGLSYGTHTVRFASTGSTSFFFKQFVVYQPKTPSLPTGAKAVSAYNIVGNYAASSATDSHQTVGASGGTLWKAAQREWIYTGTWSAIAPSNTAASIYEAAGTLFSNTGGNPGDTLQISFFGTGFAFAFSNVGVSQAYTVVIDGVNYAGAGSVSAGGSFAAPTLTITGAGFFTVTGLTLGEHTLKFVRTTATGATGVLNVGISIITPIHSYKSNAPSDIQNSLPIGSQSLEDLRKISSLEQITYQKAWAQAVGLTSNPTTASTSAVPMPDMSLTHKNTSGKIRISYGIPIASNTVGASNFTQVYIDGNPVGVTRETRHAGSGLYNAFDTMVLYVSPGVHKIDVYWWVGSGTVNSVGAGRDLLVEEV